MANARSAAGPFSVTHEVDARAHILLGGGLPVANEDGIDHETGLAFTEEQVAKSLAHLVPSAEAEEDADGIGHLAEVGEGVGDSDGPVDLRHIVTPFPSHLHLERGHALAPVVEQVRGTDAQTP